MLRWAQQSFENFTLVPPGMGICHQINLEYLSRCVQVQQIEGRGLAIPDTLVGTDSHTTMVNGLGVLGWGVGGIEAEACLLGQPLYIPSPIVVGVHLRNALPPGTTATDLVLTLTQLLRKHGMVNKFVEFCGDGLSRLSVADRATLANMCPEYGATAAFFPVDEQTLCYLVEVGLVVPPYVKTSLAPGSRVVTDYLRQAGLLPYLEQLGFYLVGYGCMTCIGGSGPLASPEVEVTIQRDHLNVVAVLSGNRNFEARIHPLVRAAYLASPPLVVAYALTGTVRRDLTTEPIGYARDGQPVFLRDLWPSPAEVEQVAQAAIHRDMFGREYATIYQGDEHWQQMEVAAGATYTWEPDSTYIREPPFFTQLFPEPEPLQDISGARVLVSLGDSITTDHITPAGNIPVESPAGRSLIEQGVERQEFNTYGKRRGNYEMLARSTWANIRLHNELAEGREGSWTTHQPSGEMITIFEAALRYRAEGVPLIALAGKEYGTGSSRDSAVKGPWLLGVKAVIAESYERIHRSNLVSVDILPLQFLPGESRDSLGLSGREEFSIRGIAAGLVPGQRLEVEARGHVGIKRFTVLARVDNTTEVAYLQHGGVLQMVLHQILKRD